MKKNLCWWYGFLSWGLGLPFITSAPEALAEILPLGCVPRGRAKTYYAVQGTKNGFTNIVIKEIQVKKGDQRPDDDSEDIMSPTSIPPQSDDETLCLREYISDQADGTLSAKTCATPDIVFLPSNNHDISPPGCYPDEEDTMALSSAPTIFESYHPSYGNPPRSCTPSSSHNDNAPAQTYCPDAATASASSSPNCEDCASLDAADDSPFVNCYPCDDDDITSSSFSFVSTSSLTNSLGLPRLRERVKRELNNQVAVPTATNLPIACIDPICSGNSHATKVTPPSVRKIAGSKYPPPPVILSQASIEDEAEVRVVCSKGTKTLKKVGDQTQCLGEDIIIILSLPQCFQPTVDNNPNVILEITRISKSDKTTSPKRRIYPQPADPTGECYNLPNGIGIDMTDYSPIFTTSKNTVLPSGYILSPPYFELLIK
jgi:hypothetical protein